MEQVHYVAKHPAEILDTNIKMYLNIYKATDILKASNYKLSL